MVVGVTGELKIQKTPACQSCLRCVNLTPSSPSPAAPCAARVTSARLSLVVTERAGQGQLGDYWYFPSRYPCFETQKSIIYESWRAPSKVRVHGTWLRAAVRLSPCKSNHPICRQQQQADHALRGIPKSTCLPIPTHDSESAHTIHAHFEGKWLKMLALRVVGGWKADPLTP